MTTVSILTPTTSKRVSYLPWVWDCIRRQTYKHIIEWLVIDGTAVDADAATETAESGVGSVASALSTLPPHPTIRIRLLTSHDLPNRYVGTLRNKLSSEANGAVLVNMDDDDFYFEARVQSAVDALAPGKVELAMCSAMFMYDQNFRQFFQYLPVFGPNHGVACTHAFTKHYGTTHRYGEASSFGEEASFTNTYQNPAVQLPAHKVLIHMSHQENTYTKKRENIWQSLLGAHSAQVTTLRAIGNTFPQAKHEKKHLQKYIGPLLVEQRSPYDVVYICGCLGMPWSPLDTRLGGSEQAVVECTRHWRSQGYTVAVYAHVADPCVVHEVAYFPFTMLPAHHAFRIVILWRALGAGCVLGHVKLNAQYLCVDLHDRFLPDTMFDYMDDIAHFFVKSQFHIEVIRDAIRPKHVVSAFVAKAVVIPNGVSDMYFPTSTLGRAKQQKPIERDPFRLCYTSCYTRGLEPLLRVFFPTLLRECPRAHLHVYYGMDGVQNQEWKQQMTELIATTPNVAEYGRCSHDVILDEKRRSTFQLYFTDSTAEIDCISIKESVLVGCIPILTNHLVYADRDGLHLPGKASDAHDLVNAAWTIGQMMREGRSQAFSATMQQTHTVIDWATTAHQWSRRFPWTPPQTIGGGGGGGDWLDTMPKFVINLQRRPHRLERFRNACTLPGVQTFAAVDGSTLDDSVLPEWVLRPPTRRLRGGELGCWLSHYGLWKRCAEGDASHMMIFEDDAQFAPHFVERLRTSMRSIAAQSATVDVLFIGGRFTREYTMQRRTAVTDYIDQHDPSVPWDGMDMDRTAHAYVLSKGHAARLIAHLEAGFDGTTPVDHYLTRTSQEHHVPMYNTRPLLCFSPMVGESDIR